MTPSIEPSDQISALSPAAQATVAAVASGPTATSAPIAAPAPSGERPGFAWDDRILKGREPKTSGYGVRPRDVRHRATLVRAAVHPTSTVRRPLVLLVLGAVLGIGGWAVMTIAIVEAFNLIEDRSLVAGPLPAIVAVASYLFGVALFAWGWELGDPPKAAKFALTAAVIGIAIWLVVALGAVVLVALAGGKGGSGGGGSGGGGGGSGGGSSGSGGSGGGSSSGGSPGGGSSPHTISMDWYAVGRALDGSARTFIRPPGAAEEEPAATPPPPLERQKGVCQFCGAAMWAEATTCQSCGAAASTDVDPAP